MIIRVENIEYSNRANQRNFPSDVTFHVDDLLFSYFKERNESTLNFFIKDIAQEKTGAAITSCDWYKVK